MARNDCANLRKGITHGRRLLVIVFLQVSAKTGLLTTQVSVPVERVSLDVTIVEAKRELIDVAAKVLLADVMVRAIDAALQQRPDRLDTIRSHVVARILGDAVIDRLMLVRVAKTLIRAGLIGVHGRSDLDVLEDRIK
jgi:hypothetical protein